MPGSRGSFYFTAWDFRALYCGGRVTLQGANPYRVEPLRTCENAGVSALDDPRAVLPAPYPGYALALFSLVARMPYHLSKAVWLAVLAGSLVISASICARLSGWPIASVLLMLAPATILSNIYYGAAPPLAMLGLLLAVCAVVGQHGARAAPALGLAMIDPHIALPSVIGFFLRSRRGRIPLIIMVAGLIGVSLWAIGYAANIEYFTRVLPEQANAEALFHWQYSLTHVLAISGVPVAVALALGSLSYAVIAACAIFFAVREPRTDDGAARAILLPAAAVCIGGTYIHYLQFALAFPAAFLLAPSVRTQLDRILLFTAFVGLMISPFIETNRIAFVLFIIACSTAAVRLWPNRSVRSAVAGAGFGLALALSIHALPHSRTIAVRAQPVASVSPDSSGSVLWGAYLSAQNLPIESDARYVAVKFPSWIALLALIFLAFRTRAKRPDGAASLRDKHYDSDCGLLSEPNVG